MAKHLHYASLCLQIQTCIGMCTQSQKLMVFFKKKRAILKSVGNMLEFFFPILDKRMGFVKEESLLGNCFNIGANVLHTKDTSWKELLIK